MGIPSTPPPFKKRNIRETDTFSVLLTLNKTVNGIGDSKSVADEREEEEEENLFLMYSIPNMLQKKAPSAKHPFATIPRLFTDFIQWHTYQLLCQSVYFTSTQSSTKATCVFSGQLISHQTHSIKTCWYFGDMNCSALSSLKQQLSLNGWITTSSSYSPPSKKVLMQGNRA